MDKNFFVVTLSSNDYLQSKERNTIPPLPTTEKSEFYLPRDWDMLLSILKNRANMYITDSLRTQKNLSVLKKAMGNLDWLNDLYNDQLNNAIKQNNFVLIGDIKNVLATFAKKHHVIKLDLLETINTKILDIVDAILQKEENIEFQRNIEQLRALRSEINTDILSEVNIKGVVVDVSNMIGRKYDMLRMVKTEDAETAKLFLRVRQRLVDFFRKKGCSIRTVGGLQARIDDIEVYQYDVSNRHLTKFLEENLYQEAKVNTDVGIKRERKRERERERKRKRKLERGKKKETERKAKARARAERKAKAKAEADVEELAKSDGEAEALAKAEELAKAKAEADGDTEGEAKALAKAEAEALAKAEADGDTEGEAEGEAKALAKAEAEALTGALDEASPSDKDEAVTSDTDSDAGAEPKSFGEEAIEEILKKSGVSYETLEEIFSGSLSVKDASKYLREVIICLPSAEIYNLIKSAQIKPVEFVLKPWQKTFYEKIIKGESVIVISSTSTGKTFIAMSSIEAIISDEDFESSVCFIAPTFDLAFQLFNNSFITMMNPMKKIGFITEKAIFLPENVDSVKIWIGTPVPVWTFFKTNNITAERIFIDEIHTIATNLGDKIISEAIYNIAKTGKQLVGLSATIRNEDLTRLIEFLDKNIIIIRGHEERPVRLERERLNQLYEDPEELFWFIKNELLGKERTPAVIFEEDDKTCLEQYRKLVEWLDKTNSHEFGECINMGREFEMELNDQLERLKAYDDQEDDIKNLAISKMKKRFRNKMVNLIAKVLRGHYNIKIKLTQGEIDTLKSILFPPKTKKPKKIIIKKVKKKEESSSSEETIDESKLSIEEMRRLRKKRKKKEKEERIRKKEKEQEELEEIERLKTAEKEKSRRILLSTISNQAVHNISLENIEYFPVCIRDILRDYNSNRPFYDEVSHFFKISEGIDREDFIMMKKSLEDKVAIFTSRKSKGENESYKEPDKELFIQSPKKRKSDIYDNLVSAEKIRKSELVDLVTLLIKGLKFGVGIILPSLPFVFYVFIIKLLAQKKIQLIFTTKVFSVGIDYPIKTVVIRTRNAKNIELVQMEGRAGRWRSQDVGFVYHWQDLPHVGDTEVFESLEFPSKAGTGMRLGDAFAIAEEIEKNRFHGETVGMGSNSILSALNRLDGKDEGGSVDMLKIRRTLGGINNHFIVEDVEEYMVVIDVVELIINNKITPDIKDNKYDHIKKIQKYKLLIQELYIRTSNTKNLNYLELLKSVYELFHRVEKKLLLIR
ncbi:MAG: hypothetical protein KatS3mg101_0809 [Patescibacteria group bacterium]|nr:MAG: hypothetical protein KatS3mg101_0809 [Patescibacteria group bacterium]